LELKAKSLAFRLLNRRTVGAIIGRLSFEPGDALARPVIDRMLDESHCGSPARGIFDAPGIAIGWCGPTLASAPAGEGIGVNEQENIRAVADSHLTNAGKHRLWCREFIDGDAPAEPLEYAVLLKAAA
jgi:hypothetical protein